MNNINLHNMNKKNILVGIIIVLVAATSYAFGSSQKTNKGDASLSQTNGRQRGMNMNRGMGGDTFVNGEILSHDDTSVTVKVKDNGSKIVFISASSTKITKTIQGSISDLSEGERVMINGVSNSDGSVTANSIQLRKDN